MKTVSIIGLGRVGTALAISLPKNKFSINSLVFRKSVPIWLPLEMRQNTVAFDEAGNISTDIVFITTRDNEIAAIVDAIGPKLQTGAVYHTSGSLSSTILEPMSSAGCEIGSIHPLVSISDPELGPERFRDSFFCVEGTEKAVNLGHEIVESLGGRPFSVDTKYKILYHAAAVTACGHLVALFDSAVEMMCETGLSAERSKEILLPLVTSTVANLSLQSTAEALTGTFARADSETFTRHINALNQYSSDELLEIYLLLGERSLELASKQGVSAERIETMRTKVAIAKSKMKW